MTITLEASPHVLATLDAAGIRYVVVDPAKALAEERERGKKFRDGSPKHAQHLERMAKFADLAPGFPQTSAAVREMVRQCTTPAGDVAADNARVARDFAAMFPQAQSDAIGALMALQGVARSVAEKMIQSCTGSTADEIVTQALRKA